MERFIAELTQKRLPRRVFRSVLELFAAINASLEEQDQPPKPYIWTKTADQILGKLESFYTNAVHGGYW